MTPRRTRALPRRDMTGDERTMALALSPLCVRYVPGSTENRLARKLSGSAEHDPAAQITTRQAEYLVTLAIRMRRQLPAHVLAIAERLAQRPWRRPGVSVSLAAAEMPSAVRRAVPHPSDSHEAIR